MTMVTVHVFLCFPPSALIILLYFRNVLYCTVLLFIIFRYRASEGVFYIGGHGCVLCQFIEPVMFVRINLHCGISHFSDI